MWKSYNNHNALRSMVTMNIPADGWHIVSYSNFGDRLSAIVRSDVQFVQQSTC